MKNMKNRARKGFTLIELMIVISIIGILAAALIPNLSGVTGRARDAQRRVAMNNVLTQIETYYIDNESYPSGSFCIDGTGAAGTNQLALENMFNGSIPQAKTVPSPAGPCGAFVGYIPTSNGYTLYMQIESEGGDASATAAIAEDATSLTATGWSTTDKTQDYRYIFVER